MQSREELHRVIHLLQRHHCCYDMFGKTFGSTNNSQAPSMCDCKFGYNGESPHSEQTGCPELRNVECLLRSMTDAEYQRIMNRVVKKNLKVYKEIQKKSNKDFWKSSLECKKNVGEWLEGEEHGK